MTLQFVSHDEYNGLCENLDKRRELHRKLERLRGSAKFRAMALAEKLAALREITAQIERLNREIQP